jgi:hypothetical protein
MMARCTEARYVKLVDLALTGVRTLVPRTGVLVSLEVFEGRDGSGAPKYVDGPRRENGSLR